MYFGTRFAIVASLCIGMAAPAGAATTIRAGAVFHTTLQSNVDTAQLREGDQLVFNVIAPYPANDLALHGATITAHVTSVTHATSTTKTRVAFLFDNILLSNGSSEPIAVYVENPGVARNVPGAGEQANSMGLNLSTPPVNRMQQATFWSSRPKTQQNLGQTGGFAYGRNFGVDPIVPSGKPVTLQLARDLTL